MLAPLLSPAPSWLAFSILELNRIHLLYDGIQSLSITVLQYIISAAHFFYTINILVECTASDFYCIILYLLFKW